MKDTRKINTIVITLNSGEELTYRNVEPLPLKIEKQPEGYDNGIDTSMIDDELSPYITDGVRYKFTQTTVDIIKNVDGKPDKKHINKKLIVFRDEAIAGIQLTTDTDEQEA